MWLNLLTALYVLQSFAGSKVFVAAASQVIAPADAFAVQGQRFVSCFDSQDNFTRETIRYKTHQVVKYCLGGTGIHDPASVLQMTIGSAQDITTASVRETVCASPLCRSAVLSFYLEAAKLCTHVDATYLTASAWMSTVEMCRYIKARPTESRRYIAQLRFVLSGIDTDSDAAMHAAESLVFDEFQIGLNLTNVTKTNLRVVGERADFWGAGPLTPPPSPVPTFPPFTPPPTMTTTTPPPTPVPTPPPPGPTKPPTMSTTRTTTEPIIVYVPTMVPGPRVPTAVPVEEPCPPTPSPSGPPTPPANFGCKGKCCRITWVAPKSGSHVRMELPNIVAKFEAPMQLKPERVNPANAVDAPPALTLTPMAMPTMCSEASAPIPPFLLTRYFPAGWQSEYLTVPIFDPNNGLVAGASYSWRLNPRDFEDLSRDKKPLCENSFNFTVDFPRPYPTSTILRDERFVYTTWNTPVQGLAKWTLSQHGGTWSRDFDIKSDSYCPFEFKVDPCIGENAYPGCVNDGYHLKLPCGLTFDATYYENVAKSLVAGTQSVRRDGHVMTRQCKPPTLDPEGHCIGVDCGSVTVTWDSCVQINNKAAMVRICSYVTSPIPKEECKQMTIGTANLVENDYVAHGNCAFNWTFHGPFFPTPPTPAPGRPPTPPPSPPCGDVKVWVDQPGVKRKSDQVLQDTLQRAKAFTGNECPTFCLDGNCEGGGGGGGGGEISKQCWLLWDRNFRASTGPEGQDAENFESDLKTVGVPFIPIPHEQTIAKTLTLGFFMPRCIIIPEIKRQPIGEVSGSCAQGIDCIGVLEPKYWRRYVRVGGVLLFTGGGKQMAGINSIFGLSLIPGFAGNHMDLEETIPDNLRDINLTEELPILNGMRCLKHGIPDLRMTPATPYGTLQAIFHGKQGVGAGGSAEAAGMGVFQISYEAGFTTYLAFDFHQEDPAQRLPWAETAKKILGRQVDIAFQRGSGVSIGRRLLEDEDDLLSSPQKSKTPLPVDYAADTCEATSSPHDKAQCRVKKALEHFKLEASQEESSPQNPRQDGDRVVMAEDFGDWLEDDENEESDADGQDADAKETQVTFERRLNGTIALPPPTPPPCWVQGLPNASLQDKAMVFVVNYRCPSSISSAAQFAGVAETPKFCTDFSYQMRNILLSRPLMRNALVNPDYCLNAKLLSYGEPMTLQALSPCPKTRSTDHVIQNVNMACNLTSINDPKNPDRYTENLEWLLGQMVQSYQGVESFDTPVRQRACQKPLCRRWIDRAFNFYSKCPNSAGVKGKQARIFKALKNVMKSCSKVQQKKNIRSQVLISGINTINPQEMHALEEKFHDVVSKAIGLTDDMYVTWHGTFNKKLDILKKDIAVQLKLQPSDSEGRPVNSNPSSNLRPTVAANFHQDPVWQPNRTMDHENSLWSDAANSPMVSNCMMMQVTPAIGAVNVNPASIIEITFEHGVAKRGAAHRWAKKNGILPVVQIYPKILKEVCEPCALCNGSKRMSWFPEEEGFVGDGNWPKLAPGYEKIGPMGENMSLQFRLPTAFLCQEYDLWNTDVVTISGQTLSIKPAHPLERNLEYIVKFPKGIVQCSAGDGTYAVWSGWPAWPEYTFTTGLPTASVTKMSIGLGCKDTDDPKDTQGCIYRRKAIHPGNPEFDAVIEECQKEVLKWRCETLTLPPRVCTATEAVITRRLEDVDYKRRLAETVMEKDGMQKKMAGPPVETTNMQPKLEQPPVLPFILIAIYCAARGTYLAVAWWLDRYVAARVYDPTFSGLRRVMPVVSILIATLVPLLTGFLGHFVAIIGYDLWITPHKEEAVTPWLRKYTDEDALFWRHYYSLLVATGAASAMTCAVAIWFLTWSWKATWGQISCFIGLIFAGGGISGATTGFVYYAQLSLVQLDYLQTCYYAIVYSIAATAVLSKFFCVFVFTAVVYPILWWTPYIGDIVRYVTWFKFYSPWKGDPQRFIINFAEIKLNKQFCEVLAKQNTLEQGNPRVKGGAPLPGILSITFNSSTAPHNKCSTRSFPLNPDYFTGSKPKFPDGYPLEGENIQLNATEIYDTINIEIYIQERFGSPMMKIAQTRWDPWTEGLLQTYFNNIPEMRRPDGTMPKLWNLAKIQPPTNPKNDKFWYWLRGDKGDPLKQGLRIYHPGDYEEKPECMGRLEFAVTHLGPLNELQERTRPDQAPFRRQYLGDTDPGAHQGLTGVWGTMKDMRTG